MSSAATTTAITSFPTAGPANSLSTNLVQPNAAAIVAAAAAAINNSCIDTNSANTAVTNLVSSTAADFLPMSSYANNFSFQPTMLGNTTYSGIDTTSVVSTVPVSAPTTLLNLGTDGNQAAAAVRYTQQSPSYGYQASSTTVSPQHPLTLHPPVNSGTANTLPFVFGSTATSTAGMTSTVMNNSANALAVTAATMSHPMTANAGYFGMSNAWNLPWSSNTAGTAGLTTGPGQMGSLFHGGQSWGHPGAQRPRLTTTLWEDEGTICYQVDAESVCVARRQDNNMINGTKLLNVVGMTRGKRDGILKNEKQRIVVKVGAMHLKGVWIPFERAKALAEQYGILDKLYPLFSDDPSAHLLQHAPSAASSRFRANDPVSGMSGYELSLLSNNFRRRTHLSPAYTPNSTLTDGLNNVDASLMYSRSGTMGSTTGVVNGLDRRDSTTNTVTACGYYPTETNHGEMASSAPPPASSSSGVMTVTGAGGSHAAWSPLTPSIDARPYYHAAAAAAAAVAAAAHTNGEQTTSSMSHAHPTSPSAIVYSAGTKRGSDYLLAGGNGYGQELYHNNYDVTNSVHTSPRVSYVNTNTYATPLSPVTSPPRFDAQSMERTYSEVEERPARKRSRTDSDANGAQEHTFKSLDTVNAIDDKLSLPGLDVNGQRTVGFAGVDGQQQHDLRRDTSDYAMPSLFTSGLDRASQTTGVRAQASHVASHV